MSLLAHHYTKAANRPLCSSFYELYDRNVLILHMCLLELALYHTSYSIRACFSQSFPLLRIYRPFDYVNLMSLGRHAKCAYT